LLELADLLFSLVQRLLHALPLDALSDLTRRRREAVEGQAIELSSRERGGDPHEPPLDEERMPDERHQAFPCGPCRIARARIVKNRARHVRPALLGDEADLRLAQGDTAVRLGEARARSSARPQLEDLRVTVEGPHARQRQVEVLRQDLGTLLEDLLELLVLVQRD